MTEEQIEQMTQAVRQSLLEELAIRDERIVRLERQVRSLMSDVDNLRQRVRELEDERSDYTRVMTDKSAGLRYRLELANIRLREHDLEPV